MTTITIEVNQALFAEAREACGAASDDDVVRRALDAVIQDRARSSRDTSDRALDDAPHEGERWRAMYAASPTRSVTTDVDDAVLSRALEACGLRPDDETIQSGLQALIRAAAYKRMLGFIGMERDLAVPDVPRRREPAFGRAAPEMQLIEALREVSDRDWALQWLTTPHSELDGRTPLAGLVASRELAIRVLALLRRERG